MEHEFDKAIADFTEIIRLNPQDSWAGWAYRCRDSVYEQQCEKVKAKDDFAEAKKLQDKETSSYSRQARHTRRVGSKSASPTNRASRWPLHRVGAPRTTVHIRTVSPSSVVPISVRGAGDCL
jgi:hypothetical protein